MGFHRVHRHTEHTREITALTQGVKSLHKLQRHEAHHQGQGGGCRAVGSKYVIKRINDFAPGPGKYFVLGLPTGGTPLGMYSRLVEAHKAGRVTFKYVKTFNMDEYVGIPRDHPESYHHYMSTTSSSTSTSTPTTPTSS